jgi:RNA polymerase sigma-70 factor, ECF subfamily
MNAARPPRASGMATATPVQFQAEPAADHGRPVDSGDERTLVVRAKHDRQAFAALYDRYVAAVYGYCYRRLGSVEAAEDATSLVFSRALAALPRYVDDGRPFRSWLFTIAHHTIVDEFRARRPHHPLAAADAMPDPQPLPEEQALANDESRRVRDLLAHLTPEQAHVLELRLAGLTDVEIAQVVGRSHGAVRAAQHRAVVRLHELLNVQMGGRDGR